MEDLLGSVRTRINSFKIPSEDKEDIIQNSMLYLIKKGITSLDKNFIYTIIKSQVLLYYRWKYMKMDKNVVKVDSFNNYDTSVTMITDVGQEQEVGLNRKGTYKNIMKLKSIPIKFRKGLAEFMTTDKSLKEVAEEENLNFNRLKFYYRDSKPDMKKVLS